jgi:hypothetical protein
MEVDLSPLVELTQRSTSQETRLSMYHVIGDVTENKLHKAQMIPNTGLKLKVYT